MDNLITISIGITIYFFAATIVLMPFAVYYAVKCRDAIFRRHEIREAILDYQNDCSLLDVNPEVALSDMESYEDTVKRFWDWGNKRIISKEKYNLIKAHIVPVTEISLSNNSCI